MTYQIEKLRPDQDLQCYFERPSAVAAMSCASANGFTVSGSWRQQFDWAVIEWNRHNVFEHPAFRNLPDGDLSHLVLTYEEIRTNCAPIDSDIYPAQPWPYLRVWTDDCGADPFLVNLSEFAEPIEGTYNAAWCEFELSGTVSQNDYVGLAFCGEHYTHQNYYDDTLEKIVEQIGLSINNSSSYLHATWTGAKIRLEARAQIKGANGNRIGVYSYVSGVGTESWDAASRTLHGGTSPSKWRVQIDFGALAFPATAVRKMRWTYAADLQSGAFERCEFKVEVSNWSVSGSDRLYRVAGPGSTRIESDSATITSSAGWSTGNGNFSGGSIQFSSTPDNWLEVAIETSRAYELYLGTRLAYNSGKVWVIVDDVEHEINLQIPGEDTLARLPLGMIQPGAHRVRFVHKGTDGQTVYFDFLELVVATQQVSDLDVKERRTLATDWDTDHSIALPPERTATMMKQLGYTGRANHYVGALWFYELCPQELRYNVKQITFAGTPDANSIVTMHLAGNTIQHLVHPGDTSNTIATTFALRLNQGYTSVWAQAQGSVLLVQARQMGVLGDSVDMDVSGGGPGFTSTVEVLQTGNDPVWRTDLTAQPRINRAARDWTRAYVQALAGYGIDAACAFSMELQHGDPDPAVGIVQRYPSGNPVVLQTPAVQTNFSPQSLAYWREVYADCAQLMDDAGVTPYLQFGEVQWWYFPYDGSGMPFCDAYTDEAFTQQYGRPARRIPNETADAEAYPEELSFYQTLVGQFTDSVMAYVRASHPDTRFEVLYPTDVNAYPINRVVNYPVQRWTPSVLTCLKTESFTFTLQRDMNKARASIGFGAEFEFPWEQRSHLVGISDPTTPWAREVNEAVSMGLESVVLFALDQFCLIGYSDVRAVGAPRSAYFSL